MVTKHTEHRICKMLTKGMFTFSHFPESVLQRLPLCLHNELKFGIEQMCSDQVLKNRSHGSHITIFISTR